MTPTDFRAWRATMGCTQQQAALALGVSLRTIKAWEGGKPDCFYAVEGGHVVGTPFAQAVDPALASLIVQFGIGFLVLLQQEAA